MLKYISIYINEKANALNNLSEVNELQRHFPSTVSYKKNNINTYQLIIIEYTFLLNTLSSYIIGLLNKTKYYS